MAARTAPAAAPPARARRSDGIDRGVARAAGTVRSAGVVGEVEAGPAGAGEHAERPQAPVVQRDPVGARRSASRTPRRPAYGLPNRYPEVTSRRVGSGPCSPWAGSTSSFWGWWPRCWCPPPSPPSPARTSADHGGKAPATIPLPNGFQPEGIAAGKGSDLFVGSIPTGAIWKGDAKKGTGSVLVPGREGRAAIGVKVDRRAKRIVVAGGPTGKAFVYGARDGRDIAQLQLAPAGQETFVNDLVLTRRGAFFTDSRIQQIYRVAAAQREDHPADRRHRLHHRQQRQRHRVGQGRQGPDHRPGQHGQAVHDRPAHRRDRRDRPRRRLAGQRRRPAAQGPHAVRGPEPPEQDRGRAPGEEPEVGPRRARDHQPRVRRAHHAGREPQGPVHGERALRHPAVARQPLRRGEG